MVAQADCKGGRALTRGAVGGGQHLGGRDETAATEGKRAGAGQQSNLPRVLIGGGSLAPHNLLVFSPALSTLTGGGLC